MYSATAISRSSMPFQGPRLRTSSALNSELKASASALTLLYRSSRRGSRPGNAPQGAGQGPGPAGEQALEAADDLGLALALEGSSGHVGAGGFVVLHPHDHRAVEGGVGRAVTARVSRCRVVRPEEA